MKHLKPYYGAGMIFYKREQDGVYVLLEKRGATMRHFPNQWSITGGGCNRGESPLDCAYREAEEEIAGGKVGVFKTKTFGEAVLNKKTDLPFYHYSTYAVEILGETEKNRGWISQPYEAQEIRWFKIDELPNDLCIMAKPVILKLKKLSRGKC